MWQLHSHHRRKKHSSGKALAATSAAKWMSGVREWACHVHLEGFACIKRKKDTKLESHQRVKKEGAGDSSACNENKYVALWRRVVDLEMTC